MNRQKMLLSVIASAILSTAYPLTSFAQDQVQQNLTVEVVTAYDECRDKYDLYDLLQRPAEVPLECIYELVFHRAEWLSGWLNEWQKINLDHLRSAYPYHGIGIRFLYVQTETTDNFALYNPIILAVWQGSPADKAGLKPNDTIRRINDLVILGTVVNKGFEVEPTLMRDREKFVKEAIADSKDPFTVEIERDGQVVDIELSKTTLGQEVADVLNSNLGRMESTNKAVRDMIGELIRQVEVSKNDKEMLLHLYNQILELDLYQGEPFLEVIYAEAEEWGR